MKFYSRLVLIIALILSPAVLTLAHAIEIPEIMRTLPNANVEFSNGPEKQPEPNTNSDTGAASYSKQPENSPITATNGVVKGVSSLNIRDYPDGNIIGKLLSGNKVKIIAKEAEWYKINYKNGIGYVHSNYIICENDQPFNRPSGRIKRISDLEEKADTGTVSSSRTGANIIPIQKRISQFASQYINSDKFSGYDAGGVSVSAKFASSILKDAGAISRTEVSIPKTLSALKKNGWKEVAAPPFKAGDIITWSKSASKQDDEIGIITSDTSKFASTNAISYSYSLNAPSRCSPNKLPVAHVLRKNDNK